MTVPMICVFVALLLTYAAHLPGLLARTKDPEGFNNRQPRAQQAKLSGWGARAVAGHAEAHAARARPLVVARGLRALAVLARVQLAKRVVVAARLARITARITLDARGLT